MNRSRAVDRVRAVVDAASRWRNADFPPRIRATSALMERTGYTEPVVDYALDRLFEEVDDPTLEGIIAGELGSLAALDGFVVRPGRPDISFRGVARAAIVASDTTIGVALPALIFALCAQVQVTVKDRDDRLIGSFAETLADEEPSLGECLQVDVWSGPHATEARAAAALADADVVVAYGSDASLVAIRRALAPGARFIGFGHRTSVGYVPREMLHDEKTARALAHAAALEALLYDGEGCLSLHALFVECGGAIAPPEFARFVADACDAVAVEFPAAYTKLDGDVLAYRRAAHFRSTQGHGTLYAGARAPHVVVYDAPIEQPPPLLRRTLALYPVDTPGDALAFVRRHALPLEAFAVAGPRDAPWRRTEDDAELRRPDVEAAAIASGAAWIAPLGGLQSPPLSGNHGGEGRILPFVRAIYRT